MIERYALGVDIGGTHTDVEAIGDDGSAWSRKVPTTPDELATGVLDGIATVASAASLDEETFLARTDRIVHGSTVTTNALLEGTEAQTGLLTTKGFRDVLELNMEFDPAVFNFRSDHKDPEKYLLERKLRRAVPERIDKDGTERRELDASALRTAAERLVEQEDVECLAVAFMNSYISDDHERRVPAILAEADIDVPVSISVDLVPEIGLYDRSTAAVVDASLKPVLSDYLADLDRRLERRGFDGVFRIMMGNGGTSNHEVVQGTPITSVNSGPAAAAVGCAKLAQAAGISDIISMDMGGTSTDICLIEDGDPPVTTEAHVGETPIPISIVDVKTVGAGGGSIAWLDDRGVLQVGPKSAGAHPGPICYAAGGTRPTVTDANLLLGLINPDYFRGGTADLDTERAREGIESTLGDRLGLSAEEVAAGIFDLANDQLYNQIRQVSIQNGQDPRGFTIFAVGGASALHAAHVAERLETDVVVPCRAGTLGSVGLLQADIRHDFASSINPRPVGPDLLNELEGVFGQLEEEAAATFADEQVEEWRLERTLETRYEGQIHRITISLPGGPLEDASTVTEQHHREHESLFSFRDGRSDVEVLSARLTAIAPTESVQRTGFESTVEPDDARKGTRSLRFGSEGDTHEGPIYDGEVLLAGEIDGPAVVELPYTTIVVPPSFTASTDGENNYHLRTE